MSKYRKYYYTVPTLGRAEMRKGYLGYIVYPTLSAAKQAVETDPNLKGWSVYSVNIRGQEYKAEDGKSWVYVKGEKEPASERQVYPKLARKRF